MFAQCSSSQLTFFLLINRAALVTYIRVQDVENHVENFWTFAAIVHNDQTHPFGKKYIRMMRKTFCMCPCGRFWIKSFKEKLWSKKYFFCARAHNEGEVLRLEYSSRRVVVVVFAQCSLSFFFGY